jgi:hypothetical protein
MSDSPETDAFIDSLHDDWDVEFANLTAHACKLERERDQWRECAEMLAFAVRLESQQTQMNWRAFAQDGLAEFERLKEGGK